MFNVLKKLIQYPRVTLKYPREPLDFAVIPGKPEIDISSCSFCGECVRRCPNGAVSLDAEGKEIGINLDMCIFCYLCEEVCPTGAVKMTDKFELAQKDRQALRAGNVTTNPTPVCTPVEPSLEVIGKRVEERISKVFGRSLQIREVDAGSCNGCDYEINGLNNPFNDLERFGIHFVASPRHADMLLVTGPPVRNMEEALIKTYNATPDPKMVVAVGACACSGGIFRDSYTAGNGIDSLLPVDAYVPGCPPRPQAILYGILKALDRVK